MRHNWSPKQESTGTLERWLDYEDLTDEEVALILVELSYRERMARAIDSIPTFQ